jgi:hypothetical protein
MKKKKTKSGAIYFRNTLCMLQRGIILKKFKRLGCGGVEL